MKVEKQWRVGHGDLFALGLRTNEAFLHAVPREPKVGSLRVSVIFRSVDKSFVDLTGRCALTAPPRRPLLSALLSSP